MPATLICFSRPRCHHYVAVMKTEGLITGSVTNASVVIPQQISGSPGLVPARSAALRGAVIELRARRPPGPPPRPRASGPGKGHRPLRRGREGHRVWAAESQQWVEGSTPPRARPGLGRVALAGAGEPRGPRRGSVSRAPCAAQSQASSSHTLCPQGQRRRPAGTSAGRLVRGFAVHVTAHGLSRVHPPWGRPEPCSSRCSPSWSFSLNLRCSCRTVDISPETSSLRTHGRV